MVSLPLLFQAVCAIIEKKIEHRLSTQKKKFYEKLSNRYSKIIADFTKKKKLNVDNFQTRVINWLFNQDEEKKMILCSVENKKYTNTIYEAFNYYNISLNEKLTFRIIEDDSDNDKYKLQYNNFDYDKLFNKSKYSEKDNYKKKNNIHNKLFNVHNTFLNDLFFYQCESPINDYENYSNYFTLNPRFLKSEQIFKNKCNEITNNQFLKNPIKIKKDPKNKNNLIFSLPNWIEDNDKNNKMNDYPYDTDENINITNKDNFTLDQYILALIEQVLSIRYILYNDNKDFQEILSSTYLYELFDKRKSILSYINNIKIETNMYYKYFKIEDINASIFISEGIEKFIKDKKECLKTNDNNMEDNDYSNNDNDSAFMNIEQKFADLVKKYKNNKDEFNKELINMCMFFQIKQLFTLDDFFFRAIFESFYTEYLNQIYNDLIISEEEKPKKKKKKKKKNNNTNIDDNQNKNIIINEENKINEKEEIYNFIKKIILDNLEDKINKINVTNNNNSNIAMNKKEKNKQKEKTFFLYEIKKKEKKKNNHKNKITNKNKLDNNEKNNNEDSNESIQDNNNINNKPIKNNFINNLNSIAQIENNNIFQNKMNISNEKLNKLNNDIDNFNNDLESLLLIIRKIKKEILYHFESIIKNIYESNSKVEIYGSSLYQLDIESSDLDLGITTKSNLSLDSLAIYLDNNNNNNQYLNLNYIYTASIPIIKLEVDFLKLDNDNIYNYYQSLINNNYYKICINNNLKRMV